ncbi:hypothetical protein GCM10028781_01450 [Nostocoides australiense]
MFAPHERGKAMATFSALAGLAAVVGPIMGSLLTETAGWRWVFLVNVPVGVLALAAALRFVPESRAAHANRVDFRGVAVLSAGLLALLYPLVVGHELAGRQHTHAPAEIFRPAFLVVLAVMAVLLLVAVATTVIPADAHEHACPGCGPLTPRHLDRKRRRYPSATAR